jgi:hypothetical protein
MKRFVFRVLRDGHEDVRDEVELESVDAARTEAAKVLLDVARDDVHAIGWQLAEYRVDVCNTDGLLLFSHALTTYSTTALASR